ncbi:hypothetical protein SK128_017934 [Halocaridina rubra]|uniref:Ig-like domain-containing protein n=1 Tax=Halocaridina rubra TaxID=373956 RepID=A0AAN8WSJ3_HALRR
MTVEPPQVLPFSMPDSLRAGSRVAVQCVAVQGDPPVTITWLHNGSPATSTPGVTVTPLGQFVAALMIEKVRPHHSGNYTCQASSPAATAYHTAVLLVHDDEPLQHVSDLQVSQHDSFSSILALSHVRPSHSGNYTCVARNEAKEVRFTAELLVRAPTPWSSWHLHRFLSEHPSTLSSLKGGLHCQTVRRTRFDRQVFEVMFERVNRVFGCRTRNVFDNQIPRSLVRTSLQTLK